MTASTLATMEPLPLVPRLNSWSGRKIAVSSLRPLDVVSGENTWDGIWVVVQNSAALQKTELRSPSGLTTIVSDYAEIAGRYPNYKGKARRRWWYAYLPQWMRVFVQEFHLPQHGA